MEINILWIDDQPNSSFLDRADSKGLNLTSKENVDDGIEELTHYSRDYDAIILDANCLSHNDQQGSDTDISALAYALKRINENGIKKPWFVYSGGGFSGEDSIDVIVKGQERLYDDKLWYKKPLEMNKLFDKITSVVKESANYQIKMKHPEIFTWYPNQTELISIISYLDESKYKESSVFNLIRKELDWVMNTCYDCGYLQIPYNGSNLGECSSYLGQKELLPFIPLHIQRSFHSSVTVCNEGSHRLEIDETIKAGKAPYLVRSTVYEFLNILYWLKDMPKSEESIELLKQEIISATASKKPVLEDYEGKEYIVEIDNGNYHCKECSLNYKIAKEYVGKKVILYDVQKNGNSKTSSLYPLYANIREIE